MKRAVITAVVVAFAVRVLHVCSLGQSALFAQPAGDGLAYVRWAERIAAGDVLGSETFYQAPLYPYVLGGWFALGGGTMTAVRLLQALWGALGAGLSAVAAARLFGVRAGWAAGLLWALYAPAVFYDGLAQKASLDGLLGCLMVALVASDATGRGATVGRALALGAVLGLLCLNRENAFVWLPVIGVWAAVPLCGTPRKEASAPPLRRAGHAAAFVLGSAIALAPVGLRNRVVGGEWSFSTFQAGPNFYIGNHRGADGRYRPLVRGHETPEFERADATRLAEESLGRALTAREVSAYWTQRTVREIRADVGGWLRLLGHKVRLVWNRYEVSDVDSLAVHRESSPVLRLLGAVSHFGVLCPLAAVGFAVTRKRGRASWVFYALIVTMTAAVALFYVLGRYRFPLVPLLIPFAGAGVAALVDLWWGSGRENGKPSPLPLSHGERGWVLLLLVGVGVGVNWPAQDERRLDALAWANAGAILGAQGDVAGAVTYLRRALAGHPQSAEIHFNLGYALSLVGDHRGAVEHYRRSLEIEPTLVDAEQLLRASLEALGE